MLTPLFVFRVQCQNDRQFGLASLLIFYISKCQPQQTSKPLSVRSMARPFNSLFEVYGWSKEFLYWYRRLVLSWLTVLSNWIPERRKTMTGRLRHPQHVSFTGAVMAAMMRCPRQCIVPQRDMTGCCPLQPQHPRCPTFVASSTSTITTMSSSSATLSYQVMGTWIYSWF